jgi:excisionase family DNA binding protein
MDRLLTVREAASMLSCSPAAIRKWMYQRRLPRVKVGRLTRVSMRDLNAFVSQNGARLASQGRPHPAEQVPH